MMWKSNYSDGVYLGISNEAYHADPAIGSTSIKKLIKSPLEYWWYSWMNPAKPENKTSAAMKLGTAYHTLMLEPEKFKYEIIAGTKTTTKEGCLAEAEYEQLKTMQKTLLAKPYHAALLNGGYAEVSVFWTDEATGLPCKCRFDYWKPHWVTDLKTTTSIADCNIRYQIPDLGYDVSGAMYMAGVDALRKLLAQGLEVHEQGINPEFIKQFLASETRFVFLMQEKDAPYDTRALAVTEPFAACGIGKFHQGLLVAKEQWDLHGGDVWDSPYPQVNNMEIETLSNSIYY